MIVLTLVLFSPILIAAACANPGLIVLLAVLWCGVAMPAGGAEAAATAEVQAAATAEVQAALDVPQAPAAEDIPLEAPAETFTLANGIPVVFKRGEAAEIVNIGLFLNMGAA